YRQHGSNASLRADPRVVVRIPDPNSDPGTETFAALTPDGFIALPLNPGLPAPYELLSESITVQGNDAYVLVARLGDDSQMSPCRTELIAYRLDPQSNWLRGTKRVAWRLTDSPGAGATSFATMLVGPREPMGPSLRQE